MTTFELSTVDIKLTPTLQTAFDIYLSTAYKPTIDRVIDYRFKIEDVRGSCNKFPHELYHFYAFMLGAVIYEQVRRGVVTDYDDYDTIYDFDNIRSVFQYYDVDLSKAFEAFGLFGADVIYPSNISTSSVFSSRTGESHIMNESQTVVTTSMTLDDNDYIYINGSLQGKISDLSTWSITGTNQLTTTLTFYGGEEVYIMPYK